MTASAESTERQPKRILVTADAVGGVWQYTVDLVLNLVSQNIQVVLATMGPRPNQLQREQLPSAVKLIESDYALEWTPEPWRDVDRAAEWLLSLRDSFQPDLVHLNGYSHANLPWGCPVLVAAHSCVRSWWWAVHGCEPGPEWAEYRRRVQSGLDSCHAVIAPSQFMAGEILRLYSVPAEKVRVIYNFSSSPLRADERKQAFCLAAGRVWDPAKNVALLLELASRISIPICIAGENEAAVEGPVRMLGQVSNAELIQHMLRAQFFLHPAIYEPFGLAVLEAARAGCCLVLADTASARELWEGAALFANARDVEQWAAVVNRLRTDAAACDRLQSAAVRRAEEYSKARFEMSYREVYRQLLTAAFRNVRPRPKDENRAVLSLPGFRLESWKRTLPERRCRGANGARTLRSSL